MAIALQTPLGDLVAARISRAEICEEYGLDYCCGGDVPLAEACAAAGRDPEAVLAALAAHDAAAEDAGDNRDWQAVSLTELVDHIEQTHHAYMKRALPRLDGLMAKVLGAHGPNHPALAETDRVYRALRTEIAAHLDKEEQVLFPLIRAMEATGTVTDFHCGSVQAPITVMENEHDNAGEALRRLRELTDDYTPPADGCATYAALLDGLAAMERDLHLHIHKENNILHPRAARLEVSLATAVHSTGKGNA